MTPEELKKLIDALEVRLATLESETSKTEKVFKLFFKTLKHWETKLNKHVMPKGVYFGVEF